MSLNTIAETDLIHLAECFLRVDSRKNKYKLKAFICANYNLGAYFISIDRVAPLLNACLTRTLLVSMRQHSMGLAIPDDRC